MRPKTGSAKRPWEQAAALALRDTMVALGGVAGGDDGEVVTFDPPYTEGDACGSMIEVELPLRSKAPGEYKRNRMIVKVQAETAAGASQPLQDSDLLKLTCLPSE